jgi:hypothetical protein
MSHRSPPSRRTLAVPFNCGVAANDHSPPSVRVDTTGSDTPARRAAVAIGTAAKLPRVWMRPSSQASSARRTLPSATVMRASPTRTCERAICSDAGAARRNAQIPRFSSASSVPFQVEAGAVGFAVSDEPTVGRGLDVQIVADEGGDDAMLPERSFDLDAHRCERSRRRRDALRARGNAELAGREIGGRLGRRAGRDVRTQFDAVEPEARADAQLLAGCLDVDRGAWPPALRRCP